MTIQETIDELVGYAAKIDQELGRIGKCSKSERHDGDTCVRRRIDAQTEVAMCSRCEAKWSAGLLLGALKKMQSDP